MNEYSEIKRLVSELIGGDNLEISDENYLLSPAFGIQLEELVADNERNAKNASEWEAASLHWMAERDRLYLALTTISECATDALK